MEKKKTRLWPKIILGVFAIVIVLLTIIVMVNNSIINKIVAKQKENVNRQNYSYTVQSNSSENTMTKIYYKDGTRIYVIQNNDRSAIMWSDSNTKEMIAMVPNTLKATIEKYDGYDLASIPYLLDEAMSRILKFSSIITSDTVNGEECYKVSSLGQKLWFSKSTGMIVKEMNGTVVKDGKEMSYVSEFKDWKFNQLTDIDVTRPNLIGYEVTNNQ
ncbi:MAG: hypothetical protein V8R45_00820 [Clostridia bacterium]